MTRNELNNLLNDWADGVISKNKTLALIWGQPFDGETEKINTTKSVSLTPPTTEESSVVQPLPLYVCKTCDHEWDNDRWYCVACNTPYRIPNPARNDEPHRLSCPTQPNQMITIDYDITVSKIIDSSDIKDQLMLLHELIIAARSGDQAASQEVDRIIKTLKSQPQ